MTSPLVPRRNSLNLIRLVLAVLVIVSHDWPLGGFGGDPHFHNLKLGSFAVGAFFCISGYLIASSRTSTGAGRYMWHRVLRIMPGYWVTLLAVALVFAPLTWARLHGNIGDYPARDATRFVGENSVLIQKNAVIHASLTNYGGSWIGALWTLAYEFICYLLVGLVGFLGWLRRGSPAIPASTALICAALLSHHLPARLLRYSLAGLHTLDLLHFLTYFGAGVSVFVFRDLLPPKWWAATGSSAVGLVAVMVMSDPIPVLCWPLAYLVLWLGGVLPSPEWVKGHDLSYGTYLYGWPVAQVLVTYRAAEAGPGVLLGATLALTLTLAFLSLRFVEEPALRLKHWSPAARPTQVSATLSN